MSESDGLCTQQRDLSDTQHKRIWNILFLRTVEMNLAEATLVVVVIDVVARTGAVAHHNMCHTEG